eukprot:Clim_evm87s215 gene=Clim_evmTU87s215
MGIRLDSQIIPERTMLANKLPEPNNSTSSLSERRDAAYKDLPWTAFFVSWIKAIEDPIHKIFFKDNDMQEEQNRVFGGHALTWPAHRVHFFDRIVRDSVRAENGLDKTGLMPATQVITLGSGLDTRSIRMAEIETPNGMKVKPRYFEVDREAILEYKKMCYGIEGYDYENDIIISGDYVDDFDGVFNKFEASGLKRDEPTTIVWEGNVMYLSPADVHQTIVRICNFFKSTNVYFAVDIMPTTWADDRVADVINHEFGLVHFIHELRRIGYPLHNGYDDVEGELVKPANDMLPAADVKGTLVYVSNEPCKQYADPQEYPDVSDDCLQYRMINFIYQP